MSDYLKKLKEAISTPNNQAKTSQSIPVSTITSDIRNIRELPNEVRRLRQEIAELRKWKDSDAIPKINKSLTNIENINTNITSKILPDIQNIHTDISANLVPRINDATQKSLDASNIAVFAKNASESARNEALGAAELVKKFYGMFQDVGNGLVTDMKNVVDKEKRLMEVMAYETGRIKTVFTDFGVEVKDRSIDVAASMQELAKQLIDAVEEIKIPMDVAATNGLRILPRANRLDWLGALSAAYHCIAYMVWAGYGGQNSVLLETIEAFVQISRASTRLRSDFNYFGSGVSRNAEDISLQISRSVNNIKLALNDFIGSFQNVFYNMSMRLQTSADKAQQILSQKELREKERLNELGFIQEDLRKEYLYNISIQEKRVEEETVKYNAALKKYNESKALYNQYNKRLSEIAARKAYLTRYIEART